MLYGHTVTGNFLIAILLLGCTMTSLSAQVWLDFNDVSATNILADPLLSTADPEEKDYLALDVDLDGDLDLISVRKLPFTTFGNRPNVLFMNVSGIMTDMTSTYAPQFISTADFPNGDNARDIQSGNFNGDIWPDLIIANAGNDSSNGQQPRLFINLGEDISGNWLGYEEESNRIPFLISTLGSQPNACAVGVGDLTGNGVDDFYLVDYNNNLDDRLLINDGTGFFTDETDTRMPSGFVSSAFATAGAIADLNGDGFPEIIKNTTPSIRVAYNNPANPGFFTLSQNLNVSAAYHFDIGDLNADGKLDLMIIQDGQDQFQINTSAIGAIPVTWDRINLTNSPLTGGFGGNVHIADLDGDLDMDVVITDVDTDVPGCGRRMAFLQNDGTTPTPNISDPYSSATFIPAHHQGTYDVALADFNNDGAMDMWVGHCDGTTLYYSNVIPTVPPVTGLTCLQVGVNAQVSWTNTTTYSSIDILRNGLIVSTLSGSATSYDDIAPGSGSYAYSVIAHDGPDQAPSGSCVLTVSTVNAASNFSCAQQGDDVSLMWVNNGGIAQANYDSISIRRGGVEIESLPGTATNFLDLAPVPGLHVYSVVPVIGADEAQAALCSVTILGTDLTELVLRFSATVAGSIDSSDLIREALTLNGKLVLMIDIDDIGDLDAQGIDINAFQRVWCELGNFPQNHQLSSSEGDALTAYLTNGGSLFLSGGDTFCFDTATSAHALTGIDDCDDGGTGIDELEGIAVVDCDLMSFDQIVGFDGEAGFVDRLEPLTTGIAILRAQSNGLDFNAGVINDLGNNSILISQSVEFGGIGAPHDQQTLMERYLNCFPEFVPPTGPKFIRADANGDLGVNIADAVASLEYLFSGGTLPCLTAADANNDDSLDISDSVNTLAYLFSGGPGFQAPFPNCGLEASPSVLGCLSPPCP